MDSTVLFQSRCKKRPPCNNMSASPSNYLNIGANRIVGILVPACSGDFRGEFYRVISRIENGVRAEKREPDLTGCYQNDCFAIYFLNFANSRMNHNLFPASIIG